MMCPGTSRRALMVEAGSSGGGGSGDASWKGCQLQDVHSVTNIAAYLNAALEDGDTSVIAAALGDIARAKGMTQLAKETGITRDGLYKALSPTGNPSFGTVQKVVNAFGLSYLPW